MASRPEARVNDTDVPIPRLTETIRQLVNTVQAHQAHVGRLRETLVNLLQLLIDMSIEDELGESSTKRRRL